MDLGHDTVCAVATAVDLVNTRPGADDREGIRTVDDLAEFVRRRDISDVGPLSDDDVAAVRQVRSSLHEVFQASETATAVALVNSLVAEARTTPRLTHHDGWPLHIHYFAPGARLAERLAADCGMALAFMLVAGDLGRLATCAASGCDRVLVDLSRNRSRRYCDSRTCGNRLHVAAYRARRRRARTR